ncbi:hypothetical protein QD460_30790 [Rhizobium jaguaris]|uniref:hypothetical protein n=1 Tax=Rhizobium jaguaris TaxID=1312183 RepID=UPI0039BF0289
MTLYGALSLPGLQSRLNALRIGEQLTLAHSEYCRLFGTNGVALNRVNHFAAGHGCAAEIQLVSVTFRKMR